MRGFTLVELLVCLALMAMLAMASLPYLTDGGRALRLASDGRVLAALLRSARERALAARQPVAVRFDLAARSVAVEGAPDSYRLSAAEQLRVVTARGQAEGQEAVLVFQPDGGSSGAWIVIAAGGIRRSLRVDWLTGAVIAEDP